MDAITVIGAFAVVIAPATPTRQAFLGCADHGVINSPFCPRCGKPAQRVERTISVPATLDTVLPERKYWDYFDAPIGVTNVPDGSFVVLGRADIGDRLEETDCVEITPAIIAKCIDAFEIHYTDALTIMRSRANVKVKFGAVTYTP